MIADANNQVDTIVQKAQQEGQQQGYEEGSEAAKQELLQEQKEYEDRRALLEEQYQEQLAQLEPQLLDVILQVVDNVFGIQFADKKEILLHLIRKTLTGIQNCSQFQLRAGQDNYLFLETHKDEIISAVGGSVAISVMADATIEDNRCLIETDSGIYDCSIDVELKNLIKDIRSLCL
jgi:flagellar assembly protein FliH